MTKPVVEDIDKQIIDLRNEVTRIDVELGSMPRYSPDRPMLLTLKAKQIASLQDMKNRLKRLNQTGSSVARAEFEKALTYVRALCAVVAGFESTPEDAALLTEIRGFLLQHKTSR